jgi:hypothetical protein
VDRVPAADTAVIQRASDKALVKGILKASRICMTRGLGRDRDMDMDMIIESMIGGWA